MRSFIVVVLLLLCVGCLVVFCSDRSYEKTTDKLTTSRISVGVWTDPWLILEATKSSEKTPVARSNSFDSWAYRMEFLSWSWLFCFVSILLYRRAVWYSLKPLGTGKPAVVQPTST